jgi:hypothetical protein
MLRVVLKTQLIMVELYDVAVAAILHTSYPPKVARLVQSVDRGGRKQASPAALFNQLVYRRTQNPIIPLVLWD